MVMSTAKSLLTYSLTSHHFRPRLRSQNLLYGPISSCSFLKDLQNVKKTKRNLLVVYSGVQPGIPQSSEPFSSSWKSWILAIVFTVVLPFFTNKWGPFLKLIGKVETAVETAEEIVNTVEKVAEGVEKVTEDIADQFPEGGELRKVVICVEKVAEEVDKDAHIVGDFIEKVEEVESFVDSVIDQAKERIKAKEAKDQK